MIDSLSLSEKIGQLFVAGAHGTFMNATSPRYLRLEHAVRELHVGGVIWFVSNVYETALVNQRLQSLSRVPLLMSADLEAGVGMRFADTTFWPPAMAIAATGDVALAEAEGRLVAREAKALGINHILAPVADVNVDPDNPVINARSFGEDPAKVARFVTAFIRGVQSENVLATAKHFPGHGDTHVDSHRSLPVLHVSRARLDAVELVPFRAAIAAGVDAVMPGHLSVPALDPTPAPMRSGPTENRYVDGASEATAHGTLPATLSKPIIDGLLRGELGFDGLVVSDAFDMGGLTEHFEPGEAAVRAIEAGQDQILMSPDIERAIAAVKAAVASGRITESRIDESVRRILAAKARVGAPSASTDEIFAIVDSTEVRATAAEIARRAITLVRAQPETLPLNADARVGLLVVSEFNEPSNPLPDFTRELRNRLTHEPEVAVLDARSNRAVSFDEVDVVVIALAIRARSGAGTIAIPEFARGVIANLTAKRIAISFGTPYLIRELPSVGTYICAYGVQPVLQIAAARALFGEERMTGTLPVTLQ
ncbi:MAG: Beta-N-acetylhexosaminidase Beta-lactamase [Acidobacteria bacterium]|nr:Beta-N-acetylhexosaminidase Beta-lactamase [Acidobacteriota bacterium]